MRTAEHNAKISEGKKRYSRSSPTKICNGCREELPRSAFRLFPDGHYAPRCPPCTKEDNAEKSRRYHARRSAERIAIDAANNRRFLFQRNYGMTIEQFEDMKLAQGGVCAICSSPPRGRRKELNVDHCHATGKVRALLCDICNLSLGAFEDEAARFRKAADYLDAHRGV